MISHERFRLSHLMPNSWFYKLKDMKRPRPTASQRSTTTTAARSSRRSSSSSRSHHHYLHGHGTTTPKPLPLSPHRSYYPYLQQPKQMPFEKQFHLISQSPLYQRSPAAAAGDDEFHDLKLRPIRTRPSAPAASSSASTIESRRNTSGSGTCPSSPRLRSRRLHVLGGCERSKASTGDSGAMSRRRRRSGGGGGGLAVVKASSEPARDFRESMVEMVVENGMRSPEDLIELLECYLSLNSREHHGVIMEVFRGIWVEIVTDADCSVEV